MIYCAWLMEKVRMILVLAGNKDEFEKFLENREPKDIFRFITNDSDYAGHKKCDLLRKNMGSVKYGQSREQVKGTLDATYLLPPLSHGGASIVESWFVNQLSLIKPCVRFSRTRLSDVLHCKACASVQPAVVGTL